MKRETPTPTAEQRAALDRAKGDGRKLWRAFHGHDAGHMRSGFNDAEKVVPRHARLVRR